MGKCRLREYKAVVSPGSSKNRVKKMPDGTLRISVSAKASGNCANRAVADLVAKWAGVPRSSVSIASGRKSRRKKIRIA